jgi:DNA/RNA endonuclease G (NUC1)
MRGGKYYFSAVTREGSSKSERKLPNSQSKKINGVERKKIRRPNNFKSDDWYEKAALSTAISANHQH